MGFWIFKNAREKALDNISKRLEGIEDIARGEIDDDEISTLLDRMDRLEKIFAPPTEIDPEVAKGLPPGFQEVWSAVPQSWKTVANPIAKMLTGVSVDEAVTDPKKLELLLNNKTIQNMLTKMPATLPKMGQQVPPQSHGGIPPQYMREYDPNRRPQV